MRINEKMKKNTIKENNSIPKEYLNKVFLEDCNEGMAKLPDSSVDLIIADPPYNLSSGEKIDCKGGKTIQGMGGEWKKTMENWDNMPLNQYFDFSYRWLKEAKRVLKATGSMWIFGTYHNLGTINFICQLLDLEIINEVVWYKSNAFPNLAGRRLTASHETILWVHNSPKKRMYKFNYEYSKNGDFSYDNLKNPGKQMRTVWSIPNNKESWELKYGKHPTQKPARVIERIIGLSTDENDVVLSPFCGSGTDCVVSLMMNRQFIGYEISEEYIKLANERIANAPVRIF
jgi:site-specific DNA-methyltransferase (adenine-specific)